MYIVHCTLYILCFLPVLRYDDMNDVPCTLFARHAQDWKTSRLPIVQRVHVNVRTHVGVGGLVRPFSVDESDT